MNRRFIKIAVLLLLGAIVNVAVAWGCFLGSPSQFDKDGVLLLGSRIGVLTSYDSEVCQATGILTNIAVSRSHIGLPLFSFDLPAEFNLKSTTVIWPGFAINTIFYAAILWVVFFVPGKVKRTLRLRRNLCPACAYPIGTSNVCTECGAAITVAQRRPR